MVGVVAIQTIPLVVVDIREHRLPNKWVLPGYIPVMLCWIGMFASNDEELLSSVASSVIYFCALFILGWWGGMGFGDVKLAGVLGATTGMFSVSATLGSIFLSFISASVASIIVVIVALRGRKNIWTTTKTTRIAFGPFMLLGFWLAIALTVVL